MAWHQVPEFEIAASSQDDNPFADPRSQATSKISVKLPPDDWLCWQLEKLNLTLTESYARRGTDAKGLCKDQFVKTPTLRWYDVYSEKKY